MLIVNQIPETEERKSPQPSTHDGVQDVRRSPNARAPVKGVAGTMVVPPSGAPNIPGSGRQERFSLPIRSQGLEREFLNSSIQTSGE